MAEKLKLTVACGDYEIVRALKEGTVKADGLELVVLTGMGSDGTRGAATLTAAGGTVIAQDEETSVVWGMPGFVARAGLADKVLPLSLIAGEIVRRVKVGRE